MIRSLLSQLLDTGSSVALGTEDAEHALAVLLVRLARADNRYETAEMRRIDRILARRRNLAPEEAAALRAEAEADESTAPDTVRFTRVLKDRIPYEDRISVIEALWEVALVDEERTGEEDALIRLVANLLGVNDRDSALARQRVSNAGPWR